MFEKIGQSAEALVRRVNVSRRGFLGKAAKVAAGLGAVAAGVIGFPAEAFAHRYTVCPPGTQGYCFGAGGPRKANNPKACKPDEFFSCEPE